VGDPSRSLECRRRVRSDRDGGHPYSRSAEPQSGYAVLAAVIGHNDVPWRQADAQPGSMANLWPISCSVIFQFSARLCQSDGRSQLVLAIVRNLPLKEPSVLTVKGLRRILLASDGVSARIFRMLNDVATEAIETGVERITDEALERYKPVGEDGYFPMIDAEDDSHRPLPVVLRPVEEELLSSWLARHAGLLTDLFDGSHP
jgi:hypothetical protein